MNHGNAQRALLGNLHNTQMKSAITENGVLSCIASELRQPVKTWSKSENQVTLPRFSGSMSLMVPVPDDLYLCICTN